MMRQTLLASTRTLEAELASPSLRVFDATVHLRPATPGPYTVESARPDYEAAHVPGAAFIDLARDLSDPDSDLRFTAPPLALLEAALSAAGLGNDHRCVVYSATSPMWATRLWWLLKAAGFDDVRVLDGGFAKWKAEGRPVATSDERYAPATFRATAKPERWAGKDEVLAAIGDGVVCTVNALPRSSHRGESDLHYGRPGHIAGSVNVPYPGLLNRDGTFGDTSSLRGAFDAVGALAKRRVICYCGGGISATMNAFALTLLEHPDVAVYDGSLSEWARDPGLPMETGGDAP